MDQLSLAQIAELQEAFNGIDKDGSGGISAAELGALMASLGMRSARVVNGQGQSPQMGDFRKYELPGYGGGGAAGGKGRKKK